MYPLRNIDLYFGICVASVPLTHSVRFILFMYFSMSRTMPSVEYDPWSGISVSNMLSIGSLDNVR